MAISWFLVVAVVFSLLQNSVFRRWGLARVGYRREFSVAQCYEGEEIEMVETISNRKWLPIPWLRLESLILAGLRFPAQANLEISEGSLFQNHKSLFSLMPYTRIVRRHRVMAARRGCYRLSTAAMSSGDLLGFTAGRRDLSLSAELLVYPSPAALDDLTLPSHGLLGDVVVKRWISEDPFLRAGVRDYRFGDTMNAVNWKATAKAGRMQVNRNDFSADLNLMVLLNVEVTENMWDAVTDPELVERGISISATFAERAASQGMPVGFAANGPDIDRPKEPVRVAPSAGKPQLIAILEAMARLQIELACPFDVLLEQEAERGGSATDYLLVTPFVSEKMARQIERLERQGHTVVTFSPGPAKGERKGA